MTHQGDSELVVFLAHSSGDKKRVRQFYEILSLDHFRPWLDEKSLVAGQEWELEIEKAVQDAGAIVVFLSEQAVTEEGYLHKEVGLALDVAERQPEGTIVIIPIKLDRCDVPRKLRHLHWIDLSDLNRFEVNSKSAIIYARRLDLRRWDNITIGESYLRLQQALLLRSKQLNRRDDYTYYQFYRTKLHSRYLIHGRDPSGHHYYGMAHVKTRQAEADKLLVTVESRIGAEFYEYKGTYNGRLLELSGAHKVFYVSSGINGLFIGSWGEKGFEELIPTSDAMSELEKYAP